MGLLTELLSCELPENQAWRSVAIEAPGQGDLVAGLVLFMERAIDYYAAALPLTAGSEQARSEHSKGAALAALRSALQGQLSSALDARVLVPHPAGNAQKGAL